MTLSFLDCAQVSFCCSFCSAVGWAWHGRISQLQHLEIPLPGAPTVALPVDLNRDGLQDLVVAVAYTEWDQIGIDELTEMREVEGLVMVMTVVPVVMDRREIRVYLGQEGWRLRGRCRHHAHRSVRALGGPWPRGGARDSAYRFGYLGLASTGKKRAGLFSAWNRW